MSMTNEQYHGADGFSSSQLKDFIGCCPAMFKARHIDKTVEFKRTPAMNFGSAIHTYFYEPELAEEEIAIMPEINRRTKVGKANYEAFVKDNEGKIILTEDEREKAMQMVDALMANPQIVQMRQGDYEQSFFCIDDETGLMLKVRPDCLASRFVSDLKTTDSAHPKSFLYAVKRYKYHLSAAMYLDVLRQLGLDRELFFFSVIEKEAPFLTASYVLSEEMMNEGYQLYREAVTGIAECIKNDNWPTYNDGDLAVLGGIENE